MLTDDYKRLLQATHATSTTWGSGGHRHLQAIIELIDDETKTALDYGCGRATLSAVLSPILNVTNYDPGIAQHATKPEGRFDLVVCTHVLEHVEPQQLQATLEEIDNYMIRYGFFEVPHVKANQLLADGRNAHLTIEDRMWWLGTLQLVWPQATMTVVKHTTTRYEVRK